MQLVTTCLGQKVLDTKGKFKDQLRVLCKGVITDRLLSHADPEIVSGVLADGFYERVKNEPGSNETAVRHGPGRRKKRGHAPTRKTQKFEVCL
jgi:hypothetical protein